MRLIKASIVMNHKEFSISSGGHTGKVWTAGEISTAFLKHRETQSEKNIFYGVVYFNYMLMHLTAEGQLNTFIERVSGRLHLASKSN